MREWLSIIIVLLILGIVLDGVRRMRAYRKSSLRMSRRMPGEDEKQVLEEITSGDFPSGGARVVAYRDSKDAANITRSARESYTASRQTKGSPARSQDSGSEENGNDSDQVEASQPTKGESHWEAEETEGPSLGDLSNLDGDLDGDDDSSLEETFDRGSDVEQDEIVETPNPYSSPLGARTKTTQSTSRHEYSNDRPEAPKRSPLDESANPSPEAEVEDEPASAQEPEADVTAENNAFKAPDLVLVINIMARKGEQFQGEALLDALVDNGLRYGDMDIFHRHESADGKGKVLFSAANLVMPGTFELSEMDQFTTPGITMFLSLPISSDSLIAYNLMAEAALGVANALGGELKDEQRSVMTRQTIEHDRQRVIEYERKRRLERAEP